MAAASSARLPPESRFSRGLRGGGRNRIASEEEEEGQGLLHSDVEMQCPDPKDVWRTLGVEPAVERARSAWGRFWSFLRTGTGDAVTSIGLRCDLLQVEDSSAFSAHPSEIRLSGRLASCIEALGLEPLLEQSGLCGLLAHEDTEEDVNPLYFAVSFVALFVSAFGACLYIWPSWSIWNRVCGTLLFACSIFMLMNSNLVVSTARLAFHVARMKDNNERFEGSLQAHAEELRKLNKFKKGLKQVEAQFGGNIERAVLEVGRLSDVSRSDIARCTKELCRLYCDKDNDQIISMTDEFDDTMRLMSIVFSATVKDYAEREEKVREGIMGMAIVRRKLGINRRLFELIMETALSEPDVQQVPRAVRKIIAKESARASGSTV